MTEQEVTCRKMGNKGGEGETRHGEKMQECVEKHRQTGKGNSGKLSTCLGK